MEFLCYINSIDLLQNSTTQEIKAAKQHWQWIEDIYVNKHEKFTAYLQQSIIC